jgi:HK97 family phage major capsid protein
VQVTKIAIPTSSEELQELLGDDAKMKDIWREGQFAELTKAYVTASAKKNGDEISQQMREQLQTGLTQMMRENGQNLVPKIDLTAGGTPQVAGLPASWPSGQFALAKKHRLYNKAAPGAKVNTLFADQASFLQALSLKCNALGTHKDAPELLQALNENEKIRNSFGTNVPADGGFLVPEEFRSDLLMIALELTIIRQRATVIPMSGQRISIPAVDSTTDSTSVFGGITCSWVDEGTAPPETQAKFAQVVLDAKKLMAFCQAPNELVADGPAFSGFIDAALPQAMAFEADFKFMQGTGVGEPLGFVNCPAAVIAGAVSGQGASTIIVDNLAAMFARMLPSSLMNAIWVASIDTFPQLALMAVQGSLGNSTPVWMNNGVIGAPPISIYGRPVYFTEKCPALGTTGDINFIDPSFYLVGDRQTVQASASPHFAFNVDKTAYKIIERVDGRPWIQSAITPKNGGNTLSPFVQLSGTRT